MACMDHECSCCGHAWSDNTQHYACPYCGGAVSNEFDEPAGDDDPPDWLDVDDPDDDTEYVGPWER